MGCSEVERAEYAVQKLELGKLSILTLKSC